ncbi:nucleotidyltransferase domain-containing protein [Geitlerinema sp. CS-897]|nr:nucleotidyltransferase domain-containing protein [Geitlerinema sp. CS-897]
MANPTALEPRLQQRLGLSLAEIAAFCQRWQIRQFALFGSILRDDFGADSDIDCLVSFLPNARQGLLTLAKIKHDLETRSGRQVDIVPKLSVETSENWIRRQDILQTAQLIYEQR